MNPKDKDEDKEVIGEDSSQSDQSTNQSGKSYLQRSMSRFNAGAREFANWTLNDIFDFNPRFLITIRGILYIIELIFSMLVIFIIVGTCNMKVWSDIESQGFYCRPPDTYMFVVGCSSFLFAAALFLSCLFSKKTDRNLLKTGVEPTYSALFWLLYLTASVALLTNVVGRNSGRSKKEADYNASLAAGVFGIFNLFVYTFAIVHTIWMNKKLGKEKKDTGAEGNI